MSDVTQASNGSTKMSDYEEDHFLALELGGAPRDPRDLWPEPHAGTKNSYSKVSVENAVKKGGLRRASHSHRRPERDAHRLDDRPTAGVAGGGTVLSVVLPP